jgi:aspartokinase-like uncharacterized kinase
MEAVIKIGGSLAQTSKALQALGEELSSLAKTHRIVVVPGGGKLADAVREMDAKFHLPAALSHRMAILAMDQYGLMLSNIIPGASTVETLSDVRRIARQGRVPVLLPSKHLSQNDPFEPSWDVTSDSITAYFATKLASEKAVLATDVDGIYTKDPTKHAEGQLMPEISIDELSRMDGRTSVDRFLPLLLKKHPLDCYVVNGKHPERIRKILQGQKTICTRILPSGAFEIV